MKQLLLFSSILFALGSCSSPGSSPEQGNKDLQESCPCPPAKVVVPVMKGNRISVMNSAILISALLNNDFRLEKLVREKALGGYFNASDFDMPAGDTIKSGIVLWYCYNPKGKRRLPEFFVAVEKIDNYDTTGTLSGPQAAKLAVPLDHFKYNETNKDSIAVEHYINQFSPKNPIPKSRMIAKDSVLMYIENFKELLEWVTPSATELYCKYPYAFFNNNKSYQRFLARKPLYIRYYLGLAYDRYHNPNYLRPILAPFGRDEAAPSTKFYDDPFLQNSWPPPPNNEIENN